MANTLATKENHPFPSPPPLQPMPTIRNWYMSLTNTQSTHLPLLDQRHTHNEHQHPPTKPPPLRTKSPHGYTHTATPQDLANVWLDSNLTSLLPSPPPEKDHTLYHQNPSLQFIEFMSCQDHNPNIAIQQQNLKYWLTYKTIIASVGYYTKYDI